MNKRHTKSTVVDIDIGVHLWRLCPLLLVRIAVYGIERNIVGLEPLNSLLLELTTTHGIENQVVSLFDQLLQYRLCTYIMADVWVLVSHASAVEIDRYV